MDTPSPDEFGEAEITDLVAAFYRRIRTDDLIAPMYPDDDWEGSEKRLRDFCSSNKSPTSCAIVETRTNPSPANLRFNAAFRSEADIFFAVCLYYCLLSGTRSRSHQTSGCGSAGPLNSGEPSYDGNFIRLRYLSHRIPPCSAHVPF